MIDRKTLPTEVYLSLTSNCNLACGYCYANAGETNISLDWRLIKRSIDKVIENAKYNGDEEIEVTFHGTGESVLRWKTLVDAVNYTLEKTPKDWDIFFSIVTNGTLLNEEKAVFFKKHDFSVTVSMDGLRDCQNIQRPYRNGKGSFDDVVKSISRLVKYDVDFGIRSTITGLNQGEMVEFTRFCSSIGCKKVYLVPFSPAGRGEVGVKKLDSNAFVQDFAYLLSISEELGLEVHTPVDDLSRCSAGFCDADGGIFAVMPDGSISSCTRVTRKEEELAEMFFIGEVNTEGISISEEKIRNLRDLNVYSFPECEKCFAKYVCSGGCHADRFSNGISAGYCYISRRILWINLLKKLAPNYLLTSLERV